MQLNGPIHLRKKIVNKIFANVYFTGNNKLNS